MTIEKIKKAVNYWYIPFIIGIIFILIGFWVIATPLESYMTLAILFAASFLASGILGIVFSVSNRKELSNWGWLLALAILETIIGFMLVTNIVTSGIILAIYVGLTLLVRSISTIGAAVDMKNFGMEGWGWIIAFGIIGMILAIVLIARLDIAGLTLIYLTSFAFLATGISAIVTATYLRKIKKKFD